MMIVIREYLFYSVIIVSPIFTRSDVYARRDGCLDIMRSWFRFEQRVVFFTIALSDETGIFMCIHSIMFLCLVILRRI